MGSGAGGRAWGSGDGLERRAAVSPFRGRGGGFGGFFYKSLFSCALRGGGWANCSAGSERFVPWGFGMWLMKAWR